MSRDTWHKSPSPFVTKSCFRIARVKKALADCRVHLIGAESEAAGVRRPAWGPSGESTPGQPQAQVPPAPHPVSRMLFLPQRPGRPPRARTLKAGGAEGARLLPPRGRCRRCRPGPGHAGRGCSMVPSPGPDARGTGREKTGPDYPKLSGLRLRPLEVP